MATARTNSTRLIDDEMRAAGLTLAPDARALLIPLIGGDRQASRNELRKLTLYAHGTREVGVDDVIAVVSDASALELDDMVDAAFAGKTRGARNRAGEGAHRRHIAGFDAVRHAASGRAIAQVA